MTANGQEKDTALFNIDLEQGLLGAILINNDAFYDAAKVITADDFAAPMHKEIWQVCADLISVGRSVDPVIIRTAIVNWYAENEKDGGDPNGYLTDIAAKAAPPSATASYARTIRDLHLRRSMIDISREAAHMAATASMGQPLGSVLDDVSGLFSDLREANRIDGSENDMTRAMQDSLNRSADAYKKGIVPGVPWCLRELTVLSGEPLQYGSLYGLLADPGGGKTSLAMQMAYHAASNGYPAIFFSYEQTPSQCADQIHSQHLGLEARHIRQGKIGPKEYDQVHEHATRVAKMPLAVQNVAGGTVRDIRVRAQSFVRRHGKGLVIIDHAKRVTPTDFRAGLSDRVNQVYGDLKSMALDLDCAVLLLMQRNSKGFDRKNPEPVDEDCYGGIGAKENLDCLIAIWREVLHLQQRQRLEKTEEKKSELEGYITRVRDEAKLINLKARFSQTGLVETVKYLDRLTLFQSPRDDASAPNMI